MDEKHIEAERAKFEAWAGDQGYPLKRTITCGEEDYQDLRTHGAWEAWLARSTHLRPAPAAPTRSERLQAAMEHMDSFGPLEGMIGAFESQYGGPWWTDPEWKGEVRIWTDAWRACVARQRKATQPGSWDANPWVWVVEFKRPALSGGKEKGNG